MPERNNITESVAKGVERAQKKSLFFLGRGGSSFTHTTIDSVEDVYYGVRDVSE